MERAELARARLLEAALDRRSEVSWPAAVEPVDRPQATLGIPRAQAHAAIGIARQTDIALVGVAEATEDLAGGAGAVELDPVMAIGKSAHPVAVPAFPDAHEEVEIAGRLEVGPHQGHEDRLQDRFEGKATHWGAPFAAPVVRPHTCQFLSGYIVQAVIEGFSVVLGNELGNKTLLWRAA
jgi:hypothetical protein